MATKYWKLGEGFYWMTDGEKVTSEFLYIGNDKKFWYQSDFNDFVEIEEVFDAGTGKPADRESLFEMACAADIDFDTVEGA